MAARAYWKGYLKLSLVSCPISLFPATSEREKISFHQLNKETGNRIRYRKVDAGTGDEVPQENIVKGYEVGKGEYIELDPEELEAVAIDSKRTLESDEFVPKKDIDELYLRAGQTEMCQGQVLEGQPSTFLLARKPRLRGRRGDGRGPVSLLRIPTKRLTFQRVVTALAFLTLLSRYREQHTLT